MKQPGKSSGDIQVLDPHGNQLSGENRLPLLEASCQPGLAWDAAISRRELEPGWLHRFSFGKRKPEAGWGHEGGTPGAAARCKACRDIC